MKRATILLAVIAIAPRLAAAEPAAPEIETRSPGAALLLSAGTSVGGVMLIWKGSTLHGAAEEQLIAAGLVLANVGPMLGNIYAGEAWNGGLQLRLGALGAGLVGTAMIAGSGCAFYCRGGSTGLANVGAAIVVASAVGYAAGWIYEIFNAPAAARRFNQRARDIAIAPMVQPGLLGVALGRQF